MFQIKGDRLSVFLTFSFAFCLLNFALSQNPVPSTAQTKSILLMNGIAHIGNGTVIENSAIGIKNGKIERSFINTLIN